MEFWTPRKLLKVKNGDIQYLFFKIMIFIFETLHLKHTY